MTAIPMPTPGKTLRVRLSGRVALVTGGSQGLGRAIVAELAAQGATVVFTYSRDRGAADTTLAACRPLRGKVFAERADAANYAATERLLARVRRRFRRLDILVCNVGGSSADEGPIWTLTPETWDRAMNYNLRTAFNAVRACCPVFMARAVGTILFIGSINGLRGREGQPAYATTKAGLVGFMKTVAKELGAHGVNANLLATGYIDNERSRKNVKELARRQILNSCALRHLVAPEEVATCAAFLCSDAARYMTGAVIRLDSGEYI
jgi:3-oxoacyl-[acyl-carrier protein] reductase